MSIIRDANGGERHRDPRSRRLSSTLDRISVVLVAAAAMLWASDVFFRTGLVQRGLTSSEIVLGEDALITITFLALAPRVWRDLRRVRTRTLLALVVVGVGPQALATVLFTQSIKVSLQAGAVNETYLLQQVQPMIAVALAWLVLKERRRPFFWPLAALTVGAVYLVVFANAPLEPLSELEHGRLIAAVLTASAALLWASGTVLGRYALREMSFVSTTALRFAFAFPVLLVILLVADGPQGLGAYRLSDVGNLLGLALLPGIGAILLYYRGLRSTPASTATLAETTYPLTVTLLLALPAPYGFRQSIYPLQLVGTGIFICLMLALNASKGVAVVETVRNLRPGPDGPGAGRVPRAPSPTT